MADRLAFHRPDGTRQPANSGAPPIFVAFGHDDAERLKVSSIPGSFVPNSWTWRRRCPRQPDTPYRAIRAIVLTPSPHHEGAHRGEARPE